MKKKKKSIVLCLLALVFGAGMMLSSCKDNENASDVTPDEEVLEKGSEKGEALLSILSMAAGLDSLPDNWYKNTYTVEPIVGFVKDEANPYVRYVAVNDAEEAYAAYKSMVSEDLTGNAKTEQWSMGGIGTLKFNVGTQADVYATVDVDVQQLPHLKEIRFIPASAMGDNSSLFSGTPFYQFGDIVKDKQGAYWICARPASKAARKSTTHWLSFKTVDGNFKTYNKDGYATLILPDTLGNKAGSEEHLMNLFKLLYAIKNPNENNAQDLQLSGVTLPNEDIKFIANCWNRKKYFEDENIFPGTALGNLEDLYNKQNVHAFYFGHHSGKTPDVHLLTTNANNFQKSTEEMKFTWPTDDKTYNFQNYVTPNGATADLVTLQCKKTGQSMPQKALVVRYKTGYQLSGRHTIWGNDYEPGLSFKRYTTTGIEDVFVSKSGTIQSDYCIGDIGKLSRDFSYVCIKSSSSIYCTDDKINGTNIFLSTYQLDCDIIKEEECKIVIFHLLNAFLLKEKALDFSSSPAYKQSLTEINNFLEKEDRDIYSFTVNKEEQIYTLKVNIVESGTYILKYDKKNNKYMFCKGVEKPYTATFGCRYERMNRDTPSKADPTESAHQAAKTYITATIEKVEDEKGEDLWVEDEEDAVEKEEKE